LNPAPPREGFVEASVKALSIADEALSDAMGRRTVRLCKKSTPVFLLENAWSGERQRAGRNARRPPFISGLTVGRADNGRDHEKPECPDSVTLENLFTMSRNMQAL